MYKKHLLTLTAIALGAMLASCSDDDPINGGGTDDEEELAEEWYSGGVLGTTFNTGAYAYEQPSPATVLQGLEQSFNDGEYFFERDFTESQTGAFPGLGPLMVRRGCIYCHPNYGHGQRQTTYNANKIGNGYLLVIYDRTTDAYVTSLTGMPQTLAVEPFKAPIDEKQISINWLAYTDEWGNTFPDGETYSLIYPEVTIPDAAYYVPLEATRNGETVTLTAADVDVRLESTIGVYGTGLLDAIAEEDIIAQYASEAASGATLNPAMWNGTYTNYYKNTTQGDGTPYVRRFTYALSRGPLLDAAGANAIWNITNVTRSDRRYHYMTSAYARVASKDADVQKDFYTYFPQYNVTGVPETDIYNYLMNRELPVEMSDKDYRDFMVWHRGLAVPAARNVDTDDFKKGKELFTQMGCATCHRPSWTTGEDNIVDPNNYFTLNSDMPRYPNQKIWPYTDMVQHRLMMVNDIRTGWCRTTPLWGRGLSKLVTGADDRLHDCRARTVLEAIMWHGAANSDARWTVEKFRQLSKEEREAVIFFIESI